MTNEQMENYFDQLFASVEVLKRKVRELEADVYDLERNKQDK